MEVKMKKYWFLIFLVFCLILSGCSFKSSPTPQVDYQATVTSYSVDIASLTWEKQKLGEENAELKAQIEELKAQPTTSPETEQTIAQLEADKAALEERVAELEAQSTEGDESLTSISNAMMTMRDIFYGGETSDGLQILCPESSEYDFSYQDINSMVDELKQYIAEEYGVDEDQVTTEYEQIWSDYNDMIVKTRDEEYLRPYYVTFAMEGDETFNTVYDLTFQCFVDFPKLEEKLLEVRGN